MLFICAANVCRSPAMEFLTRDGLRVGGRESAWDFLSAGTTGTAIARHRMCAESASAISDLPGGAEFVETHRSRPLTRALLSRAGLVLVASHEHRSAVVRLAPAARAKTFTMLEAALLAESPVTREALAEPDGLTLEGLAEVMDLNRDLSDAADLPGGDRRGLFRARRRSLDITDVHKGEVGDHGRTLEDVRWGSEHLARALLELREPS